MFFRGLFKAFSFIQLIKHEELFNYSMHDQFKREIVVLGNISNYKTFDIVKLLFSSSQMATWTTPF